MNDDNASTSGSDRSWIGRLTQALSSNELRNREELLETLQAALQNDLLDADTFGMIEGALEVSEMQVRDAMIPRGQMVVLDHDAPLDDILPTIVETGHSRFPVVKDDRDEVVGILLAKDLLRFFLDEERERFQLTEVIRPPVFIPESKRLNVLLKDFRSSRNHMAIVVDEFGGVAGLITIEDVLEEIVGEIDDEHDLRTAAHIVKHDGNRFTVNALTPIDEFNRYFDSTFDDEAFDTIGGLVTGELGRVPELGERLELENFAIEILRSDTRRLQLLGISRLDK